LSVRKPWNLLEDSATVAFVQPIGPVDYGRLPVGNAFVVEPTNCNAINAVFVRQQIGTAWLDFEV
jgi:hypothetical protein